ncbi:hypothetical protein G9A89_023249 [Geosiphon pyriformis]|nr:hypothetical protein G9A89_023249 [Geosiphon pyriformis]
MGRLIRLELENFKSYKGHQTIGPFLNFTSVIGPNGAGKSNLMDAISFVLGVKSSQLRSSQLRDLIYRGSAMQDDDDDDIDSFSTEGRANNPRRAWVMAVYQDDNGEELKFTRSITASGASEYKINNKVFTYAKYNEMLENQKILVKARNFLVFQGDVEAIASQSPKDLTKLIEQISGSLELKTEYEQLKVQQERATENSAFNFNKKRGINAEIKQYTEQKQEAERFETLLGKKAAIQVKYLLWRLFHIQKQIDRCKHEIAQHNNFIQTKQREQKNLNNELKKARQEKSEVDKQQNNLERQIRGKESEIEDKRPTLLKLEEKITYINQKLEKYEQNAVKVQKDYEEQEKNIDIMKKDLNSVNRAASKYEEEIKGGGSRSNHRNTSLNADELAHYNKNKEEANKKTVTQKQELEILNRKEKTDNESTRRLKERLDELARRRQQLIEDKEELSRHEEKVKIYVSQLLADKDSKQNELNTAVSERTRISQQERVLNGDLQDILNKLMDARVDQREIEREQKMKDLLDSLKRVFEGVHGRVLDLCKTTQRKYDAAISIILGRNMEAIIVGTEKIGLECIQYIREQRLGHATFIPLDTIVAKPVNDKYRSILKGARLAIDVIDYPRELERALQYACGNALVCDSLDIAKTICYEKNEEVKAVTLDGTIIHKSGLITGGRSGIEAGARKFQDSDFEAMTHKRDFLMSQLNELNRIKRKGNVEEQMKGEIAGLQSKLNLFRDDLNDTKRKLAMIDDELQVIQNEIDQIRPKFQKADSSLSILKSRISTLEGIIYQIEDEVFEDFCQEIGVANIHEYEQRQLKMTQEAAEMRMKFAIQQSRLQNSLKFGEEHLKETADRLTKLQESITQARDNLVGYKEERDQILRDNKRISEEIGKLQKNMNLIKNKLSEKTEIFNNVKKELGRLTKEIDKISKEVVKREDVIKRCKSDQFSIFRKCKLEEIELPLREGSLDDIPIEDSHLQDDVYEMDIDDEPGPSRRPSASFEPHESDWPIIVDYKVLTDQQRNDPSSDIEKEFQAELDATAAEIDKMAPNLKAIERLDIVEQRLQETEKEFDTARKEAKTAKEKFNIVKQKRYRRFYEAYSHIAENIDRIYKDLTKSRNFPLGGTAYLSLEDTEEPYLHGVKYHAMPPMKRFRDMEQLSGGEKTMAALAMLFAIHSYQPSPFFVLDEVDAALDNANVGKIATYIREHADENFQFVVISLKSTLYEKAQALVGIYRDQEINSSKTLTLQVDKYEE